MQEALSDLREALKLAPQNLQLHAFSLQVKSQLERKQAKSAKNNSNLNSSKMLTIEDEIDIDENEIKALEITTLIVEHD